MNLGLIGSPVEKSISPQLQRILFKEFGLNDYIYNKYEVINDNLSSFFDRSKSSDFNGINITITHKEEALEFLDTHDNSSNITAYIYCDIR